MRWKAAERKNKRILFSWLRSFLVILLVPTLVMLAVYWKTTKVIEEEINRANLSLLTQLQRDMDAQVESIQRMSQEIALNPRVRRMLFAPHVAGAEERLIIYQILQDFRMYSSTNRSIDRFYIYYKDGGFVISDNSYYDAKTFFYLDESSVWDSFEAWQGAMNEVHRSFNRALSKSSESPASEQNAMIFMQSLPIENMQNARATLAIHYDMERLRLSMANVTAYQGGRVYVLNASNEVILASETDSSDGTDELWAYLEERQGIVHTNQSGEALTLTYVESDLMKWKYVYVLPTGLFHEKAKYIRDLSAIVVSAALLLGATLAVVLARRHYHPLRGLVNSLSSQVNVQDGSALDEYHFLEKAMENTLEANNELSIMIERQHALLQSNFLARLVKGRVEQYEPLEESYAKYQIQFMSERFAVLLFYIEEYSALFRTEEQDAEKKLKLVHLIVSNIVEELAGQRHLGYVGESDDMLFCLFNCHPDCSDAEAYDDLLKIALEAHQFIQNRFRIELTISVSNIHHTFRGIPAAYQEALQAMEYKILNANPSVITYESIRTQGRSIAYTYTLEKEQQLINFIKAGAVEKAEQIVDEILLQDQMLQPVSVEMVRLLMFDMISTMMKASMDVCSEEEELYEENHKSIMLLLQCQSVSEMRYQLSRFLSAVCSHVEHRKSSHNGELRDAVIRQIEEDYANAGLSLTVLAERCGVSPSYLSRFFKEQVGVTLSDYINKYRVEQAKKLLVREDIQQNLVAESVGFSSISTFLRAFKKQEGVTPGMYREANKRRT